MIKASDEPWRLDVHIQTSCRGGEMSDDWTAAFNSRKRVKIEFWTCSNPIKAEAAPSPLTIIAQQSKLTLMLVTSYAKIKKIFFLRNHLLRRTLYNILHTHLANVYFFSSKPLER